MNLGKKLSVGAATIGLAFGGLSLGACGSTSGTTKAASNADKSCGAGSCGGEKADDKAKSASCGGEKKADDSSKSCGAGSCG